MKTIRTLSIIFILAVIGAYFCVSCVITHVPVGMVGVRTQEYGIFGEKGVVAEDFAPGWHRDLGPVDSWVFFDSTIQTLEMTRDPNRGNRQGRDDVRVQSADGYTVSVDVTVKYRIKEGEAHKLYQNTGSGTRYQSIVRNEAEQVCIQEFGGMATEDFYNPAVRREVSGQAQTALQASLNNNYVQVLDLLIRDVAFDPEYEKKIQTKKLADQEVELNISLEKAEKKSGLTQVIEAETKVEVRIIEEEKTAALKRMQAETDREIAKIVAEYEKYATEKRADADLIAAEKQAEGSLLVETARAEGERLRNAAMMGTGGAVIVALEAARNITFEDVTISTVDTDILDIDAMTSKLGMPNK